MPDQKILQPRVNGKMVKMKAPDITKYLKLPIQFDEARLQHDLSLIMEDKWRPHFNKSVYQGAWKAIPLYSNNGDETNIFSFPPGNAPVMETSLMKYCFYFKEVVDSLKFPIRSARLLRLGAGAEIKPHRDHDLGYENGNFRLHIPIFTNEDVQFVLDGTKIIMLPGECWYTNVNYVHSVINSGRSDRVHLVIDGVRNEWSDDLFFSAAPEESFQPFLEQDAAEKIERTIEELKRNNSLSSQKWISQLEQKLAELNGNL